MAVQVHVLHSLCVLFVASLLQVHCIRLSPNTEQDDSVEVLVQYVRPDNGVNSSCPGLPCEILDYYASVSHCNNTQFILMPGLHTLSRNFTLSCLENIAFIGRNGTRDSNNTGVRIQCVAAVGFIFENVTFLTLKDLRISHCKRRIPNEIFDCSNELHHACQAAVTFKTVHTLVMLSVSVYASYGYGVAADGLYGNSTIEECNFKGNAGKPDQFIGGNFFGKYEHCPEEYTREQINLAIRRSKFSEGYTEYSYQSSEGVNYFQSRASGISLNLSCTNVSIHLLEVDLNFNKAFSYSSKGGNLFVLFGNTTHYVNNKLIVEDSRISNGGAKMGAGAYIRIRQPPNEPNITRVLCTISINFKNTNFTSNIGEVRGGAMYILFEMANMYKHCPKGLVKLTNCYFEDNILNTSNADSGVAINIYGYYLLGVLATSFPFYTVTITQCHFLRNKLIANSLDLVSGGATVYITKKRRETLISDSTFEDNSVPAVSAVRSNIVFQGKVLIRNNSGIDGGGLVLCEASYILFRPHTNVTFKENSALLSGGGIYAEEQCLESKPMCFYQINADNSLSSTQKDQILNTIHVMMINNTANHAGSQIFGGSMDKCITTFVRNNSYVYSKIFNETSWHINKSQDPSYITSRPRHICFCKNNIWNCTKRNINVSTYQGELFNVSLVAVGQFEHPVPATILAYSSDSNNVSHTRVIPRTINGTCTNITYYIRRKSNHVIKFDRLNLIVSGIRYTAGSRLRWVNIQNKHCPLGTKIKDGRCYWKRWAFYYNASDQTVHRESYKWIGYYNSTDQDLPSYTAESGFMTYDYCPLWYCNKNSSLKINEKQFYQDSQCRNRQGILCGACVESRTLAIASNMCIECEQHRYSYLPLLVLGTLAITVIVLLFMLCFNMTITDGTVSGLLFYVSIFSINRDSLLRASQHYSFLPSLISWINLDIGLSACFFKGFNAFWQTIFNFCIPIFVWLVMGLLIFASSKSRRITRLIGSNAVKVLATLFLISYTKILKTEVAVLSCGRILYEKTNENLDYPSKSHWLVDGNVECWRGKHLLLVVIGLLFGVATVLFTLALLFIQPLQRNSHRRGLKWVATLKPFFDAYTSPHVIHDHYRFWNGLLLLFRIICIILFAITSVNNEYKHYMFTVACICVLIISLMSFFGGVYKTKWLYALNVSFYFNLTILSLTSFYSLTKDIEKYGNDFQHIATSVSVSIAVATLVIITCYHVYKRLKELGLLSRCWLKMEETRCWQAALQRWSRRRVQYVRLPQEDLDRDREMDDDFDRGRESDNEQEEENREQDTSECVAEQSRDTY